MTTRIRPTRWVHNAMDCQLVDLHTGEAGFYSLELITQYAFHVAVRSHGPWWRFHPSTGLGIGTAETWAMVPDCVSVEETIAKGRHALGIAEPASGARLRKAKRSADEIHAIWLVEATAQNRRRA